MDCSPPGSSARGIFQARYWNGLSFPSPGDLPDPGIEPVSLASSALAGGFLTISTTWEAPVIPIEFTKKRLSLLHVLKSLIISGYFPH